MADLNFYSLPDSEKKAIFQQISSNTGMPAFAVEKDWWVTKTLAIIFEMKAAEHLVFKGGTSLSKAWKLIERFSEDVDLAIDRTFLGFNGDLSKNQRTQLRKAASAYTSGPFLAELETKFAEKGFDKVNFNLVEANDSDQDPRIIEIYYPNLIETPGYLQPRVQVEIGCRSLKEPFSKQKFGSLVDESFHDKDFAQPNIQIPTVNPERTFLEKIFLLHEEFRKPIEQIRVERLSRHLYDVYHLSKTEFAETALKNKELYETIVIHRQKFTRIGGINYNEHQPHKINPLPIPEVMEAWNADYKKMLEEMIYEQDPPSFEEIIQKLTKLKTKINAIDWKMETQFPIPNK